MYQNIDINLLSKLKTIEKSLSINDNVLSINSPNDFVIYFRLKTGFGYSCTVNNSNNELELRQRGKILLNTKNVNEILVFILKRILKSNE